MVSNRWCFLYKGVTALWKRLACSWTAFTFGSRSLSLWRPKFWKSNSSVSVLNSFVSGDVWPLFIKRDSKSPFVIEGAILLASRITHRAISWWYWLLNNWWSDLETRIQQRIWNFTGKFLWKSKKKAEKESWKHQDSNPLKVGILICSLVRYQLRHWSYETILTENVLYEYLVD